MILDAPVGHVATKDFSEVVLIRASHMRVCWFVLEFSTLELGLL
jgi:hypothetical protein